MKTDNKKVEMFAQEMTRRIDKDYELHFITKQSLKTDIKNLTKHFTSLQIL